MLPTPPGQQSIERGDSGRYGLCTSSVSNRGCSDGGGRSAALGLLLLIVGKLEVVFLPGVATAVTRTIPTPGDCRRHDLTPAISVLGRRHGGGNHHGSFAHALTHRQSFVPIPACMLPLNEFL